MSVDKSAVLFYIHVNARETMTSSRLEDILEHSYLLFNLLNVSSYTLLLIKAAGLPNRWNWVFFYG